MGLADEPKLYQSVDGKQIMNTIGSNDEALKADSILGMVISGTLPRSVYDSHSLLVTGSVYVFTFTYKTVRQFIVTITNPLKNYSTSIEEINNLLLETGSGSIVLENNDELLLEG